MTWCGNCLLSIINGQKASSFFCGAFDQGKRGRGLYNLGYSLNERLLLLLLLMVIGLGKLIELIQLDRFQQGLWCLYLIQIMYLCLDIKFGTIQGILLCRRHKDIWQVCRRYLKSVVWKWYLQGRPSELKSTSATSRLWNFLTRLRDYYYTTRL